MLGWPHSGFGAYVGPRIEDREGVLRVARNPIRLQGILTLTLSKPGPVRAELLDLDGRRVRTLMDGGYVSAGSHQMGVDGRDDRGQPLPTGVYFYRIHAPQGGLTGRLVIIR